MIQTLLHDASSFKDDAILLRYHLVSISTEAIARQFGMKAIETSCVYGL